MKLTSKKAKVFAMKPAAERTKRRAQKASKPLGTPPWQKKAKKASPKKALAKIAAGRAAIDERVARAGGLDVVFDGAKRKAGKVVPLPRSSIDLSRISGKEYDVARKVTPRSNGLDVAKAALEQGIKRRGGVVISAELGKGLVKAAEDWKPEIDRAKAERETRKQMQADTVRAGYDDMDKSRGPDHGNAIPEPAPFARFEQPASLAQVESACSHKHPPFAIDRDEGILGAFQMADVVRLKGHLAHMRFTVCQIHEATVTDPRRLSLLYFNGVTGSVQAAPIDERLVVRLREGS